MVRVEAYLIPKEYKKTHEIILEQNSDPDKNLKKIQTIVELLTHSGYLRFVDGTTAHGSLCRLGVHIVGLQMGNHGCAE